MGPQSSSQAAGGHRLGHGHSLNCNNKALLQLSQQRNVSYRKRRRLQCFASSSNGSGPSSNGSHRSTGEQQSNGPSLRKSLDERILSGEVRSVFSLSCTEAWPGLVRLAVMLPTGALPCCLSSYPPCLRLLLPFNSYVTLNFDGESSTLASLR